MDTNTGPLTTKGCEAMTETTAKKYKTAPERLQRKNQMQKDRKEMQTSYKKMENKRERETNRCKNYHEKI